MTTFSIPFIRYCRGAWLLALLVLPLLGWGQTTIFEVYPSGSSSYTALPASWVGNNTSSTGTPIEQGSYFKLEAAGTPDNVITGSYNLSPYTSATLSFQIATFGGGSGNTMKVEISYNGGTTYTQTYTSGSVTSSAYVAQSTSLTGTLSSQVKIRFTPTTNTGSALRLQIAKLVASGTSASPYLVVATSPATAPTTLTGFSTPAGTASASQTLTLTGANLTAGNAITITAPASFEVSTDNTSFGTTASVANAAGGTLAATPVYVRLKAGLTVGTYTNETVSVTGGGTPLATLATVSGTVTAPPTIATGTVASTPVCAVSASNVTVSYTASGTLTGTYSAQLSDAAGSFASATALTIVGSTTANPLTVTIPAGTASGTGYRIRVNNSAPSTTGTAAVGTAFTINNLTVAVAPASLDVTIGQTNATALTATETPAATSRVWKYGTVAGGPYGNTISGQTGTSYTPQPADFGNTLGTYYVVAQSTLSGCVATSNEVPVTVKAGTALNVITAGITLPTATGATVGGNVTADGGSAVSDRGVVYSATNTLPTVGGPDVTTLAIGTGTGTFSQALSLPAGTYSVRAYATNATTTAYGSVVTLVVNPTPVISSLSPASAVVGSGATTLTVLSTGNTFASGATATYNGSARTVTFVNAGQLTVALTAADIATTGTFAVVVTNPTPGGGASGSASFTVTNPAPTISSLAPNSATAGGAAFTLTVTGTGFVGAAVTTFSFGGTSYTPNTTGFSSTSFTVSIPAAAIATAGTKNVVVTNPTPGGGTATTTFNVNTGPCLSESFDGTFPPTDWLISSSSEVQQGTTTRSGAGAAYFSGNNGALTTPALAYPTSLTFYLGRSNSTAARTLQVFVSTTGQNTGFGTALATYTQTIAEAYTPFTIDLSAYSGQSQVWVRFEKTSSTTAQFRLDDVSVFCSTSPTTSVGTISGSPFCLGTAGAAVTVPFTVTFGPFDSGNTFTAYLSNDNFVTKYALNTPQAGTTAGTISGLIPDNPAIASGSNYRIRVEASSPANAGQRNATDLVVTNYRTNEVVTNSFTGVGGNTSAALSWTLPATCATRVVVIGRLGSAVTVKPTGTFTANASFGAGTDLGTVANPNQYVLFDGLASSLTVTNLANLSTYHFKVFVSNGAGFSDGSSTTVVPAVPATLTEVQVPQYISGHAVGATTHTTRLPYAFRVTIGSLQPSTTYKFYNAAIDANGTSTDGPTYGGVGSPIYTSTTGSFVRQTTPGLSSGGTFTTDASGSYTGWFGLDPTGNERFEDGDLVRMRIVVNLGDGNNTEQYFLTTTSTVQVRLLGTGASQATGVRGSSFGTAKNIVLTYDNTAGTGRPLAASWLESDGSDASNYVTFYGSSVNGAAGAWGLLTPNTNANGIRRVEQRALTDGTLVSCAATDADGTWPSGVNTVSPAGGATALVFTTGDAPLAAPTVLENFSPTSGEPGTTLTINGTNFPNTPRPTVSFNGGTPVTAGGTSATSLTVVVPAGATTGPLSVSSSCATATTTASFTVIPLLAVSATSLPAFNTVLGTPSAAQSFTLTGSSLTADATVTAPAGYELALMAAGTYAPSLTLTPAQAAPGQLIYVRLSGATGGTFAGSIDNASAGATTRSVAVTGTVVATPAATPAPTVTAGTPGSIAVTLTLGAGAGTNLLVVVRLATAPAVAPTNLTAYAASTTYGTGATTGAGNYVVFAAPNAGSVTVTGLSPTTSYVADIYTYNVGTAAGFEQYQPAGGTSGVFTTTAIPPTAPGVLLVEDNFDYNSGRILTSISGAGWIESNGSGSNDIVTVTGNVLSATYPRGAALSSSPATTSTRAQMQRTGPDVYKAGTRPASAAIYAAAIISVSSTDNGDYFLGMTDTSIPATIRNRVFIAKVGNTADGKFQFGLTLTGEVSPYAPTSPTLFDINTNYVVVVKSENSINTGNMDVASLFVLPVDTDISQEPATPLLQVSANTSFSSTFNAVALRQGGSAAAVLTIDGVRLATGWGAAVGRPTYTEPGATIAPGNYYDITVNNSDVAAPSTGVVNVENNLALTSGRIATTATNGLLLYQAATVSGGNSTSFVSGPVRRQLGSTSGGASYTFPVGKGTAYRPLTLNVASQSNAVTYTAEQIESAPANNTYAAGSNLTRVSFKRYFTINRSTSAGTFSGKLTMAFGTDDYVNVPADPTFVVAKRSTAASNWTNIGHTAETGAATNGAPVAGTITSDTFTDFSDFSLASTSTATFFPGLNPLPVELISFTAQRQQANVSLQWATASEKNSAYFEVQRSQNAEDFTTVAKVNAAGSSTKKAAYQTLDHNAPTTQLYYRLRQVDNDGSVAYSPVTVVTASGKAFETAIYPNPARETLNFSTASPTSYRISNVLGQVLLQGTATAGTAAVAVTSLASGTYYLELQSATGRTVRKFSKE